MKKRTYFILAGMAVSKDVLAIATTVGVTALVIAPEIDRDPIPWVLGAVFGTLSQAWLPAVEVKEKAANKLFSFLNNPRVIPIVRIGVSIALAGFGSEYLRVWMQYKELPVPPLYLASIAVASLWPLAAQYGRKKFEKWSES